MRKALMILCCFLATGNFHAQNPNGWDTVWANSYGGPNIDYGSDLKETSDKGFIIAGTSSSFGSGNTSFYIIKTDSLGRHQWSKTLGTSANDIAYTMEIAGDKGFFFAGASNWDGTKGYDGYLIKTDSLGNVMWTKNYGDDDWDFIYNSCKMPDGGLVLCGETYSGTKGGSDAWLIRITATGDTLWTTKMGTMGNDAFYAVTLKNNRLYVVGKQYDALLRKSDAVAYKLDLNGKIIKSDLFTGNTTEDVFYNNLYITQTGKLLLAGGRTSDTSNHCVLRKTDTTTFNEYFYMTSNVKTHFNTVIENSNGDMYAAGQSRTYYALDVLCFRYDSVFTQLSYTWLGGNNDESCLEMIRTGKGYAFIGYTTTYGNHNNSKIENVFLAITNKPNLAANYFTLLTECFDDLSPVEIQPIKLNSTGIRLFPNPVVNELQIGLPAGDIGNITQMRLTSILGKEVLTREVKSDSRELSLELSNVEKGIYFLQIFKNGRLLANEKVIKL